MKSLTEMEVIEIRQQIAEIIEKHASNDLSKQLEVIECVNEYTEFWQYRVEKNNR